MRGVPSSADIICLKKYQAIARAHTEATGTNQKTEGMFMILMLKVAICTN